MRCSGARPGRLTGNWLLSLLLLTAVALLLFSGCARSRTTSTLSWSGVAAASDDDFVYVATKGGRLIQLAADTGVPVSAPFVAPQTGQNAAAPAFYGTPTLGGGRVYLGAYNGIIYSM